MSASLPLDFVTSLHKENRLKLMLETVIN